MATAVPFIFRSIAPNRFFGVRTRATLSNEPLWFETTIEDPGALREAVSGADAVLHLAAATKARSFEEYEQANAVVLGVSPDPPKKLRAFADKYGLPFTLLGDEDHSVAEAGAPLADSATSGIRISGAGASFVMGFS